MGRNEKESSSEEKLLDLVKETNELLRCNLILFLAEKGVPHQSIRKIVGGDMKVISEILKPLKGKLGTNGQK